MKLSEFGEEGEGQKACLSWRIFAQNKNGFRFFVASSKD
jgi:hypothetical protein